VLCEADRCASCPQTRAWLEACAHALSPRSRANAWLADLSDFPDAGEKVLMRRVEGDEQEPIAIFLAGELLTRLRHGDRGAWLICHCQLTVVVLHPCDSARCHSRVGAAPHR